LQVADIEKENTMADKPSLEERVVALEKDIAGLKEVVSKLIPKPFRWEDVVGSMNDFPEFDEVLRLGRELRKNFPDDPEA
jgi:hypothetical protein